MFEEYKEHYCHGKLRLCLYIEADCHGDSEYYCEECLKEMLINLQQKIREEPCGK